MHDVSLTCGNTSAVGECICSEPEFLLWQSKVEPGEISAVFIVQACWQYHTGWLRRSKENKPSTTLFGDQLLILFSKRSRKVCPCNDDYGTQNLQSGSWKNPEALN